MRQQFIVFFVTMLLLGWSSCGSYPQGNPTTTTGIEKGDSALPWAEAYDFDGDKKNDEIIYDYTGGAHCCYKISVFLTSREDTIDLPFSMDGGYVGGLDLSQPERFNVLTSSDGLPEILMEIETYNGSPQPIPAKWKRKYGVESHLIAVGFPNGAIQLRNLEWDQE